MAQNHVIIGLGGTGGKIIRALRRQIFEEYRSKDPIVRHKDEHGKIQETPHPVKLAFLYVDSDAALMDPNHASWKVPGDTVQLGRGEQLLITGANLVGVMENLGAYPNVSPWIGDRAAWRDILGSVVGEALGGQKRRLGRFLFACKAKETGEGFLNKIKNQVDEIRRKSGENNITFHVCAGLAGGTGSGSIIDVITQIRRLYPDDAHRIVLYCLLPEDQPPPDWNTGNYHANGYGALVELNALSVGAYFPHDVSEGPGRVHFKDASGNPVSPFNGAYLFSNENENGRILNLARDEISSLVASFLFQKIVVAQATPWSDTLRRTENAENGDGTPESMPGINIPQRSKRFLTFGIKRLIIPEEEIREYITYSFARQAALQLQFNNWSATQGYVDLAKNEAFAQYVSDARNHERWKMADVHLCLEKGILPAEVLDKWTKVEDEWKAAVNGFAQVAMNAVPKEAGMSKLTQLADNHFNVNWRSKGVVDFFRMKEGDIRDQSKEIRSLVEVDLWTKWASAELSMFDISRLLADLRSHLEERLSTCERSVVKYRALVEDGKTRSELAAKIRDNNVTWAKIGPISDLLGKRKNTIQAQAECFKDFYAAKHRIEAWAFARKLLLQVIEEISDLLAIVQANTSNLAEMVKGDSNSSTENRFEGLVERVEARCKESFTEDLKDQIVKMYDPKAVRAFTQKLVRDEEIQGNQTKAVRDAIIRRLGERADFSVFRQKMVRGTLLDVLEEVCDEQAFTAHNNLVAADPSLHRTLGANIVDTLCRSFSGNPMKLNDYIRQLVDSAGNYLRMDDMNAKKEGPGAGPYTAVSQFAILIPKAAENPDFRDVLVEAFKSACSITPSFFENPKTTEITMVGIRNLFPLRYAKHLALLRDKYRERLARNPRAKIEVHTEGDGEEWPPVFLPEGDVVRKGSLSWLLLGKATGCVRLMEDPDTGSEALYLVATDERGREEDPILLAASEEELTQSGDPVVAYKLENIVRSKLAGEYLHKTKRDQIQAALDENLRQIQLAIPNTLDKRRKAHREAVDAAEAILNQK
jgi:hypothetical protein